MSEPFTDAHVHFWDHALPGLRWRFLEPDFDHPRLKGTQRLDAPRFGPDELLAEASDQRPDKVVHIQCALLPAPTPTQETAWLERHRLLWDARFDDLESVVQELKRKEQIDGSNKRK